MLGWTDQTWNKRDKIHADLDATSQSESDINIKFINVHTCIAAKKT